MQRIIPKIYRVFRHPINFMKLRINSFKQLAEFKLNAMGNQHCCYICGHTFNHFYPFRDGWKSISPFIIELRGIGSDVINFRCPFCGSHDRERHLFMYFDKLDLWSHFKDGCVLHFAPESHLAKKIEHHRPVTYVKADISPDRIDVQKIDATDIPFPDSEFDFIICNHILEHIIDDRRALSELFRVLKPGGYAVLQTPYSSVLAESFCDPAINTEELRKHYYGQEDHVRYYGRDIFQKIEKAGFSLRLTRHQDILPEPDHFYYGVNPKEDLILATKS